MGFLDDLLEPVGISYDDLNPEEQETLHSMVDTLQKSQLSLSKVRDSIARMKIGVEQQLAKEPNFIRIFIFKVENPQIIRLQARLKNYLLLEALLSTPEKAKQALDQAVANLKPRKA